MMHHNRSKKQSRFWDFHSSHASWLQHLLQITTTRLMQQGNSCNEHNSRNKQTNATITHTTQFMLLENVTMKYMGRKALCKCMQAYMTQHNCMYRARTETDLNLSKTRAKAEQEQNTNLTHLTCGAYLRPQDAIFSFYKMILSCGTKPTYKSRLEADINIKLG